MQSKLVNAWGPYAAGTTIVDNKVEEAAAAGAVRVSPARFATLHEGGYFAAAEPERSVPSEVTTAFGDDRTPLRYLKDEGPVKGGPRSATFPKGQGGKTPAEEP